MDSRPIWTLNISASARAALASAGYETVSDLVAEHTTADSLAAELSISEESASSILQQALDDGTVKEEASSPLRASAMVSFDSLPYTLPVRLPGCKVLERGTALDICGPPGSGRGLFALSLVREAVLREEEVLIIDTQGSLSADRVARFLNKDSGTPKNASRFVHHVGANNLEELVAVFLSLPQYLSRRPQITLLAFSTLSTFVGQGSLYVKDSVVNVIKEGLACACAQFKLAVVCTSALTTLVLGKDGQRTTFEMGGIGYLGPQLSEGYLPENRAKRIMLSRHADTGVRHARLMNVGGSSTTGTQRRAPGVQRGVVFVMEGEEIRGA